MKKYSVIMFVLLTFSSNLFAQWDLLSEESTLSFVSIKKGVVAEVSQFNQFKGMINKNGEVSIAIDLSSVDTKIGIRDQRIKNKLFETSKYSHATLKGKVDIDRAENMNVGEYYTDIATLQLSLHGTEKSVSSEVTIIKLNDDKWLVSSAKPVIINAADFSLVDGVNTLRALAGLSSIAMAIPVTFELVFSQK
jgi:polyisoprenoid-binding protein YceI